jgi:tetratricopeptide (TPR) repeat protein
LLYSEGHERIARGEYEEAIDRFDRLLRVDPTQLPADSPAYDEGLLGELAHDGRAFALFKAGCYAEAADAYQTAEAAVDLRVERGAPAGPLEISQRWQGAAQRE